MTGGKDVKISNIQLGLLLVGFFYGSTALMNPAGSAGRESWIAVILGWALGLMLIIMYVKIAQLNPGKTLIEMLRINFGNVIGSMVSALYIWYFIHLASLVTRNFGEFMTTTSYTETPMSVIVVLFVALTVYVVRSGLEVLGRVSEVVVWAIPVIIFIASAALWTIHDFSVLIPLFEKGIKPVLSAGFALSTFPFGEAVAFMMVFPYLNKKEYMFKTAILSATAIGFLFLVSVSRDLVILGPKLMTEINYSPDIVTKLVPGVSVEPFLDINLLIGGGIKVSICLYAAVKGTAELLKFENYRPLVTAFGAFFIVLSFWLYTNALEMMTWAKDIWPYYSLPFQYLIPAILLITSYIRSKKSIK
ncbi:MAG: endospore germination permease [Clostridia bacterium]|nr:endospore germination permease [Clostridia bacterium]